jgi:DICT domain-containing protein
VCAEGIETGEHLHRAMALGAKLGQGFLFGRPGPLNAEVVGSSASAVPMTRRERRIGQGSPFDAVAGVVPTRMERKDTVLALARYLECQAAGAPDPPIILAAVQRAEFFEGETRDRYHRMAASSPLVVVYGSDVEGDLGHGVRGARLRPTDPLVGEWIVLTLGANTAAALVAREVGDAVADGSRDGDRRFEVALTNDRTLITSVAHSMLTRVMPDGRPVGGPLACV